MKIEIEIDEAEMQGVARAAVTEAVKSYVLAKQRSYYLEHEVKKVVDRLWAGAVAQAVEGSLRDLPAVERMAREVLERKVNAQLTRLMKQRGAEACA